MQVVPASGPREEMVLSKPLKRVSDPCQTRIRYILILSAILRGSLTASLFGALEILASAAEVDIGADVQVGYGLR